MTGVMSCSTFTFKTHGGIPGRKRRAQGGFSMVEMLMAAFILAVGILGLTALQVLTLRVSREGRSLGSAAQVADRVMDQVEMEGRLTWLDRTDSQYNGATAFTKLRYIATDDAVLDYFGINGNSLAAGDPNVFFTTTTTRTAPELAATGQVHSFTVSVAFVDNVNGAGVAIDRNLTITRRILHG